jgi:hypothetical protein
MLAAELLTVAAQVRQARAASSAPGVGADGGRVTVAVLSAPSAYKALLAAGLPPWLDARLFEYDTRFAAFGPSFVRYDYAAPLAFPPELRGAVDVVILDPPFINADCLGGFARTVYALRRDNGVRTLVCTGAVMLRTARALLGVRPVRAAVRHAANRLSNPFSLYVNYDDAGRLGGVDAEAEAAAERETAAAGGGGASSASAAAPAR